MGSVRRNAPGFSNAIARFGLAAILGIANSGCAGVGSFRGSDYPFLGGFWDFGKHAEPVVGGNDSYAQQMSDAQAKAADRQARLEKASEKKAGSEKAADRKQDKQDKPAKPDDAANSEDPKPRIISSQARARNDQNAIRVTLGRPESLPVVTGAPGQAPPQSLLASNSPTPKWKKESSRTSQTDEEIDAEPAPAPKRAEIARNTRPSREFTESPARSRDRDSEPREELARSNEEKVEEILDQAKKRLDSLDVYQVSMSRVERVAGKLQPQEDVLLSVRRKPRAVRLQWESGPSKGREVIYSTSLDDKVIHVNMANAAIPLPRMSIAVDSPLIMKNSRHSIREAGFDTIIAHMSEGASPTDTKGTSGGKVTYKGVVKRQGTDGPCHLFVRNAPNGEKWEVLLDAKSLLPRSVVAHDAQGELLERYTYRDIKENPIELSSVDAFDPDSRWGKSRGLFSRLAGGAAGGTTSSAPATTR